MQRFLPLVVVLALVVLFLAMMLSDRNPKEIKSVIVGREAPAFSLPGLKDATATITDADLKSGQPILVNFFASWCVPCRAEHEHLMELARERHIPIIGIAYKDDPEKARAFLEELGDPYMVTANDADGRTGIDWGVSGVPETFVIDGKGIVRYRHWGPVVDGNIEAKVMPAIEGAR
ncbi:MAG: DsbE family thiol:disulfide interchange protein [Alphaproteobacteria bacterium]|nr:MAG: DsbE family thiol:disulfide interchange protein [Alphaproteobacteria bacterium]